MEVINADPSGEPEINPLVVVGVPGENQNPEPIVIDLRDDDENPVDADDEMEHPADIIPEGPAEEWIEFVAEQLVEWNVTHEELYGLVSIVHGDYNELALRGSPLIQPAVSFFSSTFRICSYTYVCKLTIK